MTASTLLGRMKGDVPGAAWPPLFSNKVASLAALTVALDGSQWLPPDQLAAGQERQLALLTAFLAQHSEPFRQRLAAADIQIGSLDLGALRRLPPLTRRELQGAGDALHISALPPGHTATYIAQTSGSTGEPVRVRRTKICDLYWLALSVRYHDWHEPDFRGRLASLRVVAQEEARTADWGWPMNAFFETGTMTIINNGLDLARQIDKLRDFQPTSLMIYPSNLAAMLERFEQEGIALPSLERVRTISEMLPEGLRAQAERQLGTVVRDCYSSEEFGYLAIECPDSGLYHLMQESLLIEVVDGEGKACGEGETGALLVTDLHNHAMPMIRYAIGDHAEVGPACSCGRGLPTLRRVLGRERNMVIRPDGTTAWPMTGYRRFREVAPVVQFQLVQQSLDSIEAKLVVETPLSSDQERKLAKLIRDALGYRFTIVFTYVEGRLPTGANGKFEEFVRAF